MTLPQMFMEIVECVGKYLCSMSKVSLSLNSFLWMSASSFPKRPLSFYWGAFSHRNDKMLLWKCVLLWWHNKNVFASHITHIYYLSLYSVTGQYLHTKGEFSFEPNPFRIIVNTESKYKDIHLKYGIELILVNFYV